jgi:hypothetical protein
LQRVLVANFFTAPALEQPDDAIRLRIVVAQYQAEIVAAAVGTAWWISIEIVFHETVRAAAVLGGSGCSRLFGRANLAG